jgi:hypothetical protein
MHIQGGNAQARKNDSDIYGFIAPVVGGVNCAAALEASVACG